MIGQATLSCANLISVCFEDTNHTPLVNDKHELPCLHLTTLFDGLNLFCDDEFFRHYFDYRLRKARKVSIKDKEWIIILSATIPISDTITGKNGVLAFRLSDWLILHFWLPHFGSILVPFSVRFVFLLPTFGQYLILSPFNMRWVETFSYVFLNFSFWLLFALILIFGPTKTLNSRLFLFLNFQFFFVNPKINHRINPSQVALTWFDVF